MLRRPRALSPSESINVTRLPLTAMILPRSGRLVTGADMAATFADLPLEETTSLVWFVHGHRHRFEWEMHAAALEESASTDVIARGAALVVSTDATVETAFMLRVLRQYPQRGVRMLVHTGVNTGHRCGLLHSLSATAHLWARFGAVVFTHPDVYLRAPAPAKIGQSLLDHPDAAFLGHSSTMFYYKKRRPQAFLSDLFAFRPRLLPGTRIAMEPPRLDPRRAGARAGSRAETTSRSGGSGEGASVNSLYWWNASRSCSFSMDLGRGMLKPEMALADVRQAFNVSVAEWAFERNSRGHRLREPSPSGVWHAHNVSLVAAALGRRLPQPART